MSRLLTWVLRLLPVLGIVLALVGVGVFGRLPDSWWDPKGFLVNIASSLTAACFGVPLAFFVLQKLLNERASKDERARATRLAVENLEELRVDILAASGIDDEYGQSLDSLHKQVIRLHSSLVKTRRALMENQIGELRINAAETLSAISIALIYVSFESQINPDPDLLVKDAETRLDHNRTFLAQRLLDVGLEPSTGKQADQMQEIVDQMSCRDIFERHRSCQSQVVPRLQYAWDVLSRADSSELNEYYLSTKAQELDLRLADWLDALTELRSEIVNTAYLLLPIDHEIGRLKSAV